MCKIIGALVLLALLLFFAPILGTLVGAGVGTVVGWWFGSDLLPIFARLGLAGFSMWQLGAFLGFVGGFFRVASSSSSS